MKKIISGVVALCSIFCMAGCKESKPVIDNYPTTIYLSTKIDTYNFSVDSRFDSDWELYQKDGVSLVPTKVATSLEYGSNQYFIKTKNKTISINLYRKGYMYLHTRGVKLINSFEKLGSSLILEEFDTISDTDLQYEEITARFKDFYDIKGCTIENSSYLIGESFTYTPSFSHQFSLSIEAQYKKIKNPEITFDFNGGLMDKKTKITFLPITSGSGCITEHDFSKCPLNKYHYEYSLPCKEENNIALGFIDSNGQVALKLEKPLLGINYLQENRYVITEGIDLYDYWGQTLYAIYE